MNLLHSLLAYSSRFAATADHVDIATVGAGA
jgi:hypothetical protein